MVSNHSEKPIAWTGRARHNCELSQLTGKVESSVRSGVSKTSLDDISYRAELFMCELSIVSGSKIRLYMVLSSKHTTSGNEAYLRFEAILKLKSGGVLAGGKRL